MVLPDIGRNDRIPIFCEVIEPPDNMLRFDRPICFLLIGERMRLLAPGVNEKMIRPPLSKAPTAVHLQ